MTRFSLVTLALLLFGTAAWVPGVTARPEAAARFEYMRLTPGLPPNAKSATPEGYMACVAGAGGWVCRQFGATDTDHEAGLRSALATLGSEGWELVSMTDETQNLGYPKGLTYVFKRRVVE
jgi:hypothetical protein